MFYQMACAGTPVQTVYLCIRKAAGTGSGDQVSGLIFLRFDFKLVAIKTIAYSHDDESPKETMTFEYGGLQMRYTQQQPNGQMATGVIKTGWNRVKNISDTTPTPI
jgi:type VI protein secretion system component Hcp